MAAYVGDDGKGTSAQAADPASSPDASPATVSADNPAPSQAAVQPMAANKNWTPGFKRMIWISRIAVAAVFLINMQCAFGFVLDPQAYIASFEVSGGEGEAIVRGVGILMLMWNVTYPLVIIDPARHKTLFAVVISQQIVGVVGESWLRSTVPPVHEQIIATITRFVVFDMAGLIAMTLAYILLCAFMRRMAY